MRRSPQRRPHRPSVRLRSRSITRAVLAFAALSVAVVLLGSLTSAPSASASGSAVVDTGSITGWSPTTFGANDDDTYGAVPLGFTIDFYGSTYSSVYVNNNGNLTFTGANGTYTPSLGAFGSPIIAPFFADVDTRGGGGVVNFGTGTLDGSKVFAVNWPGVGCYDQNHSVLDNFQVILIDKGGSNSSGDDFDIEFNYNQIQWDAGTASSGDANCINASSGNSAYVGYSNGSTSFELPGSGVSNAFLDGGPDALVSNDVGSSTPGRYVFSVVNGQPTSAPANTTPTPSISGTPTVGGPLIADPGMWTGYPTPTVTDYTWQHCDSSNTCSNVQTGTSNTYTPVVADAGDTIQVLVTETNSVSSTQAGSDPTTAVTEAPANTTPTPSISGTPTVGGPLIADPGMWTGYPTPTVTDYTWQHCDSSNTCSNVQTGTSNTYTPVVADAGDTIQVLVTEHNSVGDTQASSSKTTAVVEPPSNTAAPMVSGPAQQDQTLMTTDGTWLGNPTPTFTYKWQRCDSSGSGCADISGAVANAYVPSSIDVGHRLRSVVTGNNAGGHVPAPSATTPVILIAAPSNQMLPMVSGTAQEGAMLSVSDGTWLNSPVSFFYQWWRCDASNSICSPILGEKANHYVPGPLDVGQILSVVVTASNTSGFNSVTSAPTPIVSIAAPGNMALPAITGTPQQDQVVSASQGGWSDSPTDFSYAWFDCDANGANCVATSVTQTGQYVPGSGDIGHTLRVTVTASNASGHAAATSAPSPPVLIAAPVNTGAVSVFGSTVQGEVLSASNGGWGNSPTGFTFQWLQCDGSGAKCVPIDGAMASAYVPVAGDVGHTLRVIVTATNDGGNTPVTSPQTPVVAGLVESSSATPPPPVPVLSSTTDVTPISGTILIRLPGATTFTTLPAGASIPLGSTIDATNGTVSVTTALPGGGTQTGQFYDGEFVLGQSPTGTVIPVLTGGSFSGCPKSQSGLTHAGASIAKKKKKPKTVVRQLWGNAHGNYTTKGRYASASVSGTIWDVQDRCDGTYIAVTKDNVIVLAYKTHKHYNIQQGHSILIPAP